MPTYVSIDGIWRESAGKWVSIDGVWRQESDTYSNLDGVWRAAGPSGPGPNDGFGSGADGDIVYSNFGWAQLADKRYVVNAKSFRVPVGKTLTTPNTTTGLWIFSQGDIIIDGNIDLRNKGYFHYKNGPVVPNTVNIKGSEKTLAYGGGLNCANNGDTGSPIAKTNEGKNCRAGRSGDVDEYSNGTSDGWTSFMGHAAYVHYNGGSHMGPGYTSAPHGNEAACMCDYCNKGAHGHSSGANYQLPTTFPANLVLVAYGDIIINGTIYLNGRNMINSTNGYPGHQPKLTSMNCDDVDNHYINRYHYTGGKAGTYAIPPTGGGGITLISSNNRISGSIQTNGGSGGTSPATSRGADLDDRSSYGTGSVAEGGDGCEAGTLPSSNAGQILKYTH